MFGGRLWHPWNLFDADAKHKEAALRTSLGRRAGGCLVHRRRVGVKRGDRPGIARATIPAGKVLSLPSQRFVETARDSLAGPPKEILLDVWGDVATESWSLGGANRRSP
jgi:hypothetical protein